MALHHVSQSALNSFDQCEVRYKAERIEKVAVPPSRMLTEGILAHAAIERFVNELYESSLDRGVSGAIDSIVERVFRGHPGALSTESFDAVLLTCRTFSKYFVMDPERVIGVEMELLAEFHPDCPPMLSFLDFVTKEVDDEGEFIGITDWKTFWGRSQKPRDVWQLLIYGWQLRNRYPAARIGVRNHFVRANIKTPWVFPNDYDLANALLRAKLIFDRQEQAYAKRSWTANPGEHCEYCPIPDRCPVIKGLVAEKHVILTDEDGQARLREVVVFEAAVKKLTAALKERVDAAGPVVVTSPDGTAMQAEFKTSDDSVTLKSLPIAYEQLGDELFGLVNVDGKKIKKYLDDPRLDGNWDTKPGRTAFGIGKVKADEEGA